MFVNDVGVSCWYEDVVVEVDEGVVGEFLVVFVDCDFVGFIFEVDEFVDVDVVGVV